MVVYDALDLYIPNAYRHQMGHLATFGRTRLRLAGKVKIPDLDDKLPNKWSGAVSLQRQTADNFVSKRAYLRDQ